MKIKIREIKDIYKFITPPAYNKTAVVITSEIKYLILRGTYGPLLSLIEEIPLIKNYASYTINSSNSINSNIGCSTQFIAPTYTFPSWDDQISTYPSGFTFGFIKLNDFFTLTKLGYVSPNTNLTC